MIGNIYITGPIGTFTDEDGNEVSGFTLMDAVTQVKKFPGMTELNVFMNTPGGEIEEGFSIYDYLLSLGVPINMIGTVMVASIGTVIFMAGTKRMLRPGTEFFIHVPSGGVQGTADYMEGYLAELRAYEKKITKFYTDNLPDITEQVILPLLKQETSLTEDQCLTLGFITEKAVAAAEVPIAHINLKSNKMTKEDKDWISQLFGKVEGAITAFTKGAKTALMTVTDATGVILTFPDLAEGDVPAPGAKATVDGKPAEGDYLLPTGETYAFTAGELKEIKPAETAPDAAALALALAENATLKGELEATKAELTAAQGQVTAIAAEVKAIKANITSKFTDTKKEGGKKDGEEGAPQSRSLLKKKE